VATVNVALSQSGDIPRDFRSAAVCGAITIVELHADVSGRITASTSITAAYAGACASHALCLVLILDGNDDPEIDRS
jgi:hypothetical protein